MLGRMLGIAILIGHLSLLLGCKYNPCACTAEHPIQEGRPYEYLEAYISGEVVQSDYPERVGYRFPEPGQGDTLMIMRTNQLSDGAELSLEMLVQTGVASSYFLRSLNGRYQPAHSGDAYLDDSGREQLFYGENGERLSIWVSQLGPFGDVLGLWGNWESASGDEIISLRFMDLDFRKSSCWPCYHRED